MWAPDAPKAEPDGQTTVYVTKRGKRYHVDGCPTIRGGGRGLPLAEAAAKYRPCARCKPPVVEP